MNGGDRIDEALRSLGEVPPPPPGDLLQRELAELRPVATRRPHRQLAILLVASLAAAGGLLAWIALRRDLELLPRLWLILYSLGWAVGFAGLATLAVLPRRGQVSPAWRLAGTTAATAGALFVVAGLLLSRTVPGVSVEVGWGDLWSRGNHCLGTSLASAVVPVALGLLFLRRAVPVGPSWVGAAIGAGGGALGGLVLHLHCPITHGSHLGLIHGGGVILCGLLGALAGRLLLRP